jgi:hypothetical protein
MPMIHGTQTICPSVIFAVPDLLPIPGHALVRKAVIVAGVAAEVQAKIIQASKNTVGRVTAVSIVANGSIKIGRLPVNIVNDENTKIGRERKTKR